MNRFLTNLSLLTGLLFAVTLHGSVYDLEEISWENPKFVKAFTGTYAFDTAKTPSITSEENTFRDSDSSYQL